MVAVRSDSTIEHLSDLNDRRVAVMSSTMPESIFLDSNDSRIPDVRDVYCMDNMDLVFAALQSGYVDATAGHETVMRQFMKAMPGEYRLLEEDLLSVGVGVAFEKGEPSEQFLQLSQAMDDMREDGMLEYTLALYGVGMEKVEGEDQHE
jgi:polar amino acid transport system substrate-binding protein